MKQGDSRVVAPKGVRARNKEKAVEGNAASLRASKQKLKLLYLIRLFEDKTDKNHGLRITDLIEELEALGITAERKALYRDIETLRTFGMDIRSVKHHHTVYYLHSRDFSYTDLKFMIDAVRSARFLTSNQSDALVRRIKSLAPEHQQSNLTRPLDLVTCKNMENSLVVQNIESIQIAMSQKRRIQFRYATYNVRGKIEHRHNGKVYDEIPVRLVYADSFYYLVAFSEEADDFKHYRVDRMHDLLILSAKARRNKRIAAYENKDFESFIFGMFGNEESPKSVTLLVEASAVNSVLDRFGVDIDMVAVDDTHARLTVRVVESPPFYGWVAQFGSQVVIESPSSVRKNFAKHLKESLGAYE